MKLSRRQFLKACGYTIAANTVGGVGLVQYGSRIEPHRPVVERIQVPINNLNPALDGFRIVQISDIHIDSFTQMEVVQATTVLIEQLQPNLIVLTGDYVSRRAGAISELIPFFGSLKAEYGVFAILGNHERWTNAALIQERIEKIGIEVLVNRGVALDIAGATLHLAGVDDCWSGQPDLPTALVNRPSEATTILLAHEPDFADGFAEDGRVAATAIGAQPRRPDPLTGPRRFCPAATREKVRSRAL